MKKSVFPRIYYIAEGKRIRCADCRKKVVQFYEAYGKRLCGSCCSKRDGSV